MGMGEARVFVHIRDFVERIKMPETGDVITYTLGHDKQGRVCATSVMQVGYGGQVSLGAWIGLAVLLAAPVYAVVTELDRARWPGVAGAVAVASLITFALYAFDKGQAKRGAFRMPEAWLHLAELAGGWPGAFLAQRALRHKSTKPTYRFTFGVIVLFHQFVAVDLIYGWEVSRHLRELWNFVVGS